MIGSVALCGFMGCGKTTIGKRLAKELGRTFLDLDEFIEKKTGMTVSEIFAAYGEAGFREREAAAAEEAARMQDVVIACGGGTVLFRQNLEALHRYGGTVILLDVPLGILQQRLKNDRSRPLLQRPDRESFIEQLYRERMPRYLAAADAVVIGGGSIRETTEQTAALLRDSFPVKNIENA